MPTNALRNVPHPDLRRPNGRFGIPPVRSWLALALASMAAISLFGHSHAADLPVVQIATSFSKAGRPPDFRLDGTRRGGGDDYEGLATLRRVPCPGSYQFRARIDNLLTGASATYTSTVAIRDFHVRGARVTCGRPLPGHIGTHGVTVDLDGVSETNSDRHIHEDGGPRRGNKWAGRMTVQAPLCGGKSGNGRYRFVARFRGAKGRVVIVSYRFDAINTRFRGDRLPCK